jgi:hypothetical protein
LCGCNEPEFVKADRLQREFVLRNRQSHDKDDRKVALFQDFPKMAFPMLLQAFLRYSKAWLNQTGPIFRPVAALCLD